MKLNIITSYPKSGNTWMRYIVYELFFNPNNRENDNSLNIKRFIPDLHQIQLKNNQLILDEDLKNKEIFIKSHYSFDQMKNFPMDKIILVVRNPLDVFVSLYNYYDLDDKNKEQTIGGPDILSLNDISKLALEALNKPVKITHFPDWLRRFSIWILRTFTSVKRYAFLRS